MHVVYIQYVEEKHFKVVMNIVIYIKIAKRRQPNFKNKQNMNSINLIINQAKVRLPVPLARWISRALISDSMH